MLLTTLVVLFILKLDKKAMFKIPKSCNCSLTLEPIP